MRCRSIAIGCLQLFLFMGLACLAETHAYAEFGFRQHLLNAESEFSAATAFDVNGDGHTDILCGAYWYEAPTWTKHQFRDVEQIRGRFDDYSNLAMDVDRDGDVDLVSVNYRSESLYWCRNPGPENLSGEQRWEQITIDRPGTSETGRLVDIDGDGQLDVLPNGTKFAAWFQVGDVSDSEVAWIRHNLHEALAGHGVGAGDINGDGRVDVVGPAGWAEAPQDLQNGRWHWHSQPQLARDAGLPIFVHDVDGDGDADLIWSRGHDVGIYWTEQIGASESAVRVAAGVELGDAESAVAVTQWATHAIDTSWSSAHTLMLADVDGDGQDDLVAGKRFQGHDGKDPGENDPLNIFWYSFDGGSRTWQRHPITTGGTCAIDLDSVCTDIDGDGDVDIVAPSRCGLHWIENLRIDNASKEPSPVSAGEQSDQAAPAYSDHADLLYKLHDGKRDVVSTPLEFGERREHIRQAMQVVMGKLPEPAVRVPLDVEISSIEPTDHYRRITLSYATDGSSRVPAFLLLPNDMQQAAPAMLCLHPTHFELGKAQLCGLGGTPSRFYAHELANLGFVCLVPDYPGFGDYQYDFSAHTERYASGTMKAIWDNIRGVDLLETLPCVDRDRIGVIGHSLGGHNALFTAALDGRLRCVVTSCGFTAFEDYYSGNLKGWTSDRYMPRILTQFGSAPERMPFDFPEVLGAISPRPIFVNAPLGDDNFAVVGVQKCEASVRPLYELLGAQSDVEFHYPDAAHDFPDTIRQSAYAWLKQKLK